MNEFGRYAENAWQLMAPDRYAALEDPNRFFSMMGQEAESRMQMVWEQLQGPDPVGETYLEKVGRLNATRMQAEEIVRADLKPEMSQEYEEESEDEGFDETTSEILQILMDVQTAMKRAASCETDDEEDLD